MVLNTTHTNKDNDELLNDMLGKPFSLWRAFKMGGIGSGRMVVQKVSPNLNHVLNFTSSLNYGSIELRPKGIILHITKGLYNYSWAIPYYQLVIYKTDSLSIHAQGRFVQFQNNRLLKENKTFLQKLRNTKRLYLNSMGFGEMETYDN
ncbi:hypothetical protein [Namhaeicola litoreus]|uniref:Uncharacterized protein n=1 Tax=Namhaeicola litoreus TaxID=1052145 RepID=A0ABW3Y4H4_9FLAO